MIGFHINSPKKALLYASKSLLGAMICWFGLTYLGIKDPIWAVITVIIVIDPDFAMTKTLTYARALNTIVGAAFGLVSLLIFGYSAWTCLLTAAFTVFIINLIKRYPINWRLAPATVFIIMDAGRLATSREQEIELALMRVAEIGTGCAVALLLAGIYTWLRTPKKSSGNSV